VVTTEETHQSTKIIPDLANVRVEPNSTRVCVKRITVLINLIIEHANGAPESGIAAIPVYSLLIGLVSFGILLL